MARCRYNVEDHPRGWLVVRRSFWGLWRKVAYYRDEDAAVAVAHVLGEYAYLES